MPTTVQIDDEANALLERHLGEQRAESSLRGESTRNKKNNKNFVVSQAIKIALGPLKKKAQPLLQSSHPEN